MYVRELGIYVNHPVGTCDHYELISTNGNRHILTNAEIREEWKITRELELTNDNFETWLENLEMQGRVKPYRKER